MSAYRIAIVGPKEAVAGFALLGVDVIPVEEGGDSMAVLLRLKKAMRTEDGRERNVYGIVFVAEHLMAGLSGDDMKRLSRGALPAIIPLPSHHGSSGYGLSRLKKIVERAVGSDILA
jgi:V/A-type H+/Na+-transporting ATPase subunit F